jgi:hypothetical protein
MNARLNAIWKQIEAPQAIRRVLWRHAANQTPLRLMIDFRSDALPAHIVGLSHAHLLVICRGMPQLGKNSPPVYSLYGKGPQGEFLASGVLSRVSLRGDVFTLAMPEWIDVNRGLEADCRQPAIEPPQQSQISTA